jgi:hypothetical protein
MYCPGCGVEINESDAFCRRCGKVLSSDTSQESNAESDSHSKRPDNDGWSNKNSLRQASRVKRKKGRFLTVRIAIGVCVGVLGAYLLVNLPAWLENDQQKALKNHADMTINMLTPESVIAKCGKPLFDGKPEYLDSGFRDLRFDSGIHTSDGKAIGGVVLSFDKPAKQDQWIMMGAQHALSSDSIADLKAGSRRKWVESDFLSPIDPRIPNNKEILWLLPCLDTK